MKFSLVLLSAVHILGCAKSDEDLRKMMQEEIARASNRAYFTNAQVIGPYTPAVKAGDFLFVSGQIGISQETTDLVGQDIESQTQQALSNLTAVVRQAGYDSSDVIQCSVFLKDMRDFSKMNLIYGGYFAEGTYPARTTVEVSNLPKNAKVEIAAVAFKHK